MSATDISMEEIAEVFRRALRGEVPVVLDDALWSWNQAYCGNVDFKFGEWSVSFFNDCDELDYTDAVTAPDGRSADFDDWPMPDGGSPWCPLDLLTADERNALEHLLESAQ